MPQIRIFLLDDHQMMLDGLRSLFDSDPEFLVIGEATRAKLALERIATLKPDLVLTDMSLPEMDGLEFTRLAKQKFPDLKVVVLSMHAERHFIEAVLKAGASGYLVKNTGKEELKRALLRIQLGEKHFSSEVLEELMKTEGDSVLTPREREILLLITRDFSNKDIASKLFISERTVETHRKNILRKTGAHSVVGLIRYAQDNGLTTGM